MKIRIVFILLFFVSLLVQGQKMIIKSKGFPIKSIERNQSKCKFDFIKPENFEEKPIVPLGSLKYDVNLVNAKSDYCLRYSFFTGKDGASFWLYKQFNMINVMNLTQEDSTALIYKSKYYDPILVEKFNCDAAGFIDFDIKSYYGKGYKYCTMISIHKHKVTNLYITLLYNDKDSLIYNTMYNATINSIRFKQESKVKLAK